MQASFLLEKWLDRLENSGAFTKSALAQELHKEVGLSRGESLRIVQQILEEIAQELVRGCNVKFFSFGSFLTRHKRARMGRNPKTGKEVKISARRVVSFRPSRIFREKIASSSS